MQSQNNLYLKTTLLLLAILVSSLEYFIPKIPVLPWLKLGLANAITLIWLYRFGFRDTILYGILRVLIVASLFGFNIFTITLATSGMIASISIMFIMYRSNLFGVITISIIGAFMHNIGQLIAVNVILNNSVPILPQIPFVLLFGTITGTITAIISVRINNSNILMYMASKTVLGKIYIPTTGKVINVKLISVILLLSILIAVDSLNLVAVIFLIEILFIRLYLNISTIAIYKRLIKFIVPLLSLFLAIIFMNLSNGSVKAFHLASIQIFKMIIWISASFIITYLGGVYPVFTALHKLFKNGEESIKAAILSIEVLPILAKRFSRKGQLRKLLFSFDKQIVVILNEIEEVIGDYSSDKKMEKH